jgi:hypothetical protein
MKPLTIYLDMSEKYNMCPETMYVCINNELGSEIYERVRSKVVPSLSMFYHERCRAYEYAGETVVQQIRV